MIVKIGITSVKGKISSKNTNIVPLIPPKSLLNRKAEMGAQTASINSPIPGGKCTKMLDNQPLSP